MSVRMRIDSITLTTEAEEYSFAFNGRCTLLDGPVGTGKSSLLELVKHALGGGAVLTPVVRNYVQSVEASLRINGETITLRRRLGRDAGYVDLLDTRDSQRERRLSVRPQLDTANVSDYLLETLGIPRVKIPRARTRATGASVPLTFNDLLAYLYIEQQEIDRSIVHHTESFREPKRRAMFELMFGLSNAEQLTAETELGKVKDELRGAQRRSDAVVSFLATAAVQDESSLLERKAQLLGLAESASRDLDRLRSDLSQVTDAHHELRQRVLRAEEDAQLAGRRLQLARAEVAQREKLLAQLHLDVTREDKARVASRRLSPLEFINCPRCLQEINDDRAPAYHCMLCLQPVADAGDESGEEANDNIDSQIMEVAELLVRARRSVEHAEADHEHKEAALRALREELDRVTADAIAPRFQEIELLSGRRAQAIANLEGVEQLLGFHRELGTIASEVRELDQRRRELEGYIEETRIRLTSRRSVLSELSELLYETVESIQVPWAQTAELNPRNYLPLINGEPFETLSVAGGTKTAATVAYHLTLLGYALANQDTLLPQILIIDTPRKNLGSNASDSQMGSRIYSRIRTLTEAYPADVQFIIADNDVPADRDWINVISFDYDSPLIRHVLHPGEEYAKSGKLETVNSR